MGWLWIECNGIFVYFGLVCFRFALPLPWMEQNTKYLKWIQIWLSFQFNGIRGCQERERERERYIGSAPKKPFYYKWNKATVCWSCSTFAISQSLVAEILARNGEIFLWNCFLLNWRLTLDLPTTTIRKLYGTIKSNRCIHTQQCHRKIQSFDFFSKLMFQVTLPN